jgi:hypothetical protein
LYNDSIWYFSIFNTEIFYINIFSFAKYSTILSFVPWLCIILYYLTLRYLPYHRMMCVTFFL